MDSVRLTVPLWRVEVQCNVLKSSVESRRCTAGKVCAVNLGRTFTASQVPVKQISERNNMRLEREQRCDKGGMPYVSGTNAAACYPAFDLVFLLCLNRDGC